MQPDSAQQEEWSPPRLAVGLLAALALVKIALHLLAIHGYGYFRDELYYLASTAHLDWGYVEHPPFSILALKVWTALFGQSIVAIRSLSVLCGAAVVFLCGAIARELGGKRVAQGLAALCALVAPELMGGDHVYSMNAWDRLLWALAIFLLVRLLRTEDARLWPLLGLVLGVGLENKISVLWLGAGIALGLLLTSERHWLATRGPWVAAGIAALLFAPYLLWNAHHGWPTLEFMHNARQYKMIHSSLGDYVKNQILTMNPATLPVWLAGLLACLVGGLRRWRILAVAFLTVLAILALSGDAKPSYLAPAFPLLFAPGAVWLKATVAYGWRRLLRPALVTLMVVLLIVALPFAIPVLPVEAFLAYSQSLGLHPPASERHEMGELPQHFADMFGWDEMAAKVAAAYGRLSPQERARCAVFGQNYGEAGAIDVLGRPLGLPPAISGHNSYWLWGPRGWDGGAVIILGGDPQDNAAWFESVEPAGRVECARCMPYERDLAVSIGRRLKGKPEEAWPQLKHFI